MKQKRILYISGSLGLGHVCRDLAIAEALRQRRPELEISWIAAPPASQRLEEVGERLLPEARDYANENLLAEGVADGYQLNLMKYLARARKAFENNARLFGKLTRDDAFDLVIGDETYEVIIAQLKKPELRRVPFVMIYDFVGLDALSKNPLDHLAAYMLNRIWSKDRRIFAEDHKLALFVGEPEDIADRPFGFLLPNRRTHATEHYHFVGNVLPFEPAEYADRAAIRARLGYGDEPLVICTIGGTAVGRALLELCASSYPRLAAERPGLRMILVCGPRLSPEGLKLPQGVELRQYIPELFQHLAACDLAVVQGGYATTLELTALRRPFIYFPLEGHVEQQVAVAGRLARYRAGEQLVLAETTEDELARRILANLGKEVDYAAIRTDGARRAAELIDGLL